MLQVGPLGRDTIVIFNPILIDGDRMDLDAFLKSFVHQDGLYRFRINPDRVKVNKSKLTSVVLTQAGYERANFGNALTTLTYSGSTGYFWLPQAFRQTYVEDVKLSPVWQGFVQLEEFFDSLDGDVMLLDHRATLYRGLVTKFDYEERADRPWDIVYGLTFEAYTDEMFGERLGQAIKRLATYENLNRDYVASMTYSALLKTLGNTDFVNRIPGRAGVTRAIGVIPG